MSYCKEHRRKFDPSEGCELCREEHEMTGTKLDESVYCDGCGAYVGEDLCPTCFDPEVPLLTATGGRSPIEVHIEGALLQPMIDKCKEIQGELKVPAEKYAGQPGAPIWVGVDFGVDVTPPLRAQCLQECIALTTGDRNKTYGPPEPNLTLQMELWTLYKATAGDKHSMAHDAAMQHVFAKLARIASGPPLHKDNYLDLSNYSVIAYECDVEVLGGSGQ